MNPVNIYSQRLAQEKTVRASSANEEEFQLKLTLTRLQEENDRLKEANISKSEELFNMQACLVTQEAELKCEAERKIKSLESALSFREQENKKLVQDLSLQQEREKSLEGMRKRKSLSSEASFSYSSSSEEKKMEASVPKTITSSQPPLPVLSSSRSPPFSDACQGASFMVALCQDFLQLLLQAPYYLPIFT